MNHPATKADLHEALERQRCDLTVTFGLMLTALVVACVAVALLI